MDRFTKPRAQKLTTDFEEDESKVISPYNAIIPSKPDILSTQGHHSDGEG